MKCEETKKLIYLYDMITSSEKDKADRHMQNCQACREFYLQQEQERSRIRNAASSGHQVARPEKLTAQIASAIKPRRVSRSGAFEWLSDLFDLSPTQYAMAAMSLVLIGSFFYEYNVSPKIDSTKNQITGSQKYPTVNTDSADPTGVISEASTLKKQRALKDKTPAVFLNAAASISLLRDKQFLQFTENYLKGKNDQAISLYRELNQCMQHCSHDEKQNCDDCKIILNQLIEKYESM